MSSDDPTGVVLLYDDGRLACRLDGLVRPDTVAVCDAGYFAVYEWGKSTEFLGPRCRLRAFAPNGRAVFEWRPGAAVDLLALSADGGYLALATLAAPRDSKHPEDGSSVILVDLQSQSVTWRKPVPVLRPSGLGFDDLSRHVVLHTAAIPDPLRYSYKGDFLDSQVADRARMSTAIQDDRGYALLDLAKSRLGDRSPSDLDAAEAAEVDALLRQALEKQISDYTQAGARRLVGEFAEARGDLPEALAQYDGALELNPKIGLKRRVQELRGKVGQ